MKRLLVILTVLALVAFWALSAQALYLDKPTIKLGTGVYTKDWSEIKIVNDRTCTPDFKTDESIFFRYTFRDTGDAGYVKLGWKLDGPMAGEGSHEYNPNYVNWAKVEDFINLEYRRPGTYYLTLTLYTRCETSPYAIVDSYEMYFNVLPSYHAELEKAQTGAGLTIGGMPAWSFNFDKIIKLKSKDYLFTVANLKNIVGCSKFRLRVDFKNIKSCDTHSFFSDYLQVTGTCGIYWHNSSVLVNVGYLPKGKYTRQIYISFDDGAFERLEGDKDKKVAIGYVK